MAKLYPSLGSLQNQTNSPNYGILGTPVFHLPLQNNISPAAGVGLVTFDRLSEATYVDRYGKIAYANIDEPRFEKNGLLIEGSSTNIIKYSEIFNNVGYWTSNQVDLTANTDVTTAPNGLEEAYLLKDNTQTANHYIYQQVTTTASQYYTASVYLKRNTARYARVFIHDSGSNGYYSTYVDLFNGVLFNESTTGNFSNGSAAIVGLLGGWYRVMLTAQTGYTTLRLQIRLVQEGLNNVFNESYGAQPQDLNSIAIWGAQVENQKFATSYIPTETVAVTRATDLISIDIENITMNYPSAENTFIFNFDTLGSLHTEARTLFTVDGFSYNKIDIETTGYQSAYYDANGITDSVVLEAIVQHRTAVRYNNGTYSLFRNGFKVAEEQDATPYNNSDPTGIIYMGAIDELAQNVLYGHITNFRIYDVALTDDEIRIV